MSSRLLNSTLILWLAACTVMLVWGGGGNPGFLLCDAVSQGDLELTEHLLSAGTSANVFDRQGRPAVNFARNAIMLEVLLRHGATLQGNPARYRAYSELWGAASSGDLEQVRYLIGKGADPAFKGSEPSQGPPFVQAMNCGHYDVAAFLLSLNPPKIPKDQIIWGLQPCVEQDDELGVGRFTSLAEPVLRGSSWAQDLLSKAVQACSPKVASFCLDHGAVLGGRNRDGQTPLMVGVQGYYTSRVGRADLVRMLIARGAAVNDRVESTGRTALFEAVQAAPDLSVVRVMLEHGAAINAQDKRGQTPLYVAVQRGQEEMVALLLTAGADARLADNGGITPYKLAKTRSDKKMLKTLEDGGVRE